MQNASLFELRHRAQRWPNNQTALRLMDEFFALALWRAIIEKDRTIQIVIQTNDPCLNSFRSHDGDRLVLVLKATKQRMSTRVTRLNRYVAYLCGMCADRVVKMPGGSRFDPDDPPPLSELESLKRDATNLIGVSRRSEVFAEGSVRSTPFTVKRIEAGVPA